MSSAPCSALPEPDLACRTSATTVANHPSWHCGTGIVPDRDITGSWRDVDEPCASLPAAPPGRARARRGNCRLFDTGRRNPARDGLSAGGSWIRTSGTAAQKPWISATFLAFGGIGVAPPQETDRHEPQRGGRGTDSPLEEDGFELPVRSRGKPGYRPFCAAQAPSRSHSGPGPRRCLRPAPTIVSAPMLRRPVPGARG